MAKLYKLYTLIYLLFKVHWTGFLRRCRRKRRDVVLLYPDSLRAVCRYLLDMETVLHDLAVINGLIELKKDFCVHFGTDVSALRGRRVHLTLSRRVGPRDGPDYTRGVFGLIERLEAAGNAVYPARGEALFWENKVHMYEKFRELGVRHPRTWIVRKGDPLPETGFPVLLKEAHSAGSQGVFKLESRAELEARAAALFGCGHEAFILQRLVDMRSDLRAIIVGDGVGLHYWRRNTSGEWRPTSTSRGSLVDFHNFPEQWRGEMTDVVRKLGLRTGALDITWEKDDTSSPPLYLEVSPLYQPNPEPPRRYRDMPYYEYKKKRFVPGSYFIKYIDEIFRLKRALYDVYFPADGAAGKA